MHSINSMSAPAVLVMLSDEEIFANLQQTSKLVARAWTLNMPPVSNPILDYVGISGDLNGMFKHLFWVCVDADGNEIMHLHGMPIDRKGTPLPVGKKGNPLQIIAVQPNFSSAMQEAENHVEETLGAYTTYDCDLPYKARRFLEWKNDFNKHQLPYSAPAETVIGVISERLGQAKEQFRPAISWVIQNTPLALFASAASLFGEHKVCVEAYNSNSVWREIADIVGLNIEPILSKVDAPGIHSRVDKFVELNCPAMLKRWQRAAGQAIAAPLGRDVASIPSAGVPVTVPSMGSTQRAA